MTQTELEKALNLECVLCATIQHKNVVKELKENGSYLINDLSKISENHIVPYNQMKDAYNYIGYPIFLSPVGYRCQMYGAKVENNEKDTRVLFLSIPKSSIRIQEYYNWTDFIYYSENIEQFQKDHNISFDEFKQKVLFENDDLSDKNKIYQLTTDIIYSHNLIQSFEYSKQFGFKFIGQGGKFILDKNDILNLKLPSSKI